MRGSEFIACFANRRKIHNHMGLIELRISQAFFREICENLPLSFSTLSHLFECVINGEYTVIRIRAWMRAGDLICSIRDGELPPEMVGPQFRRRFAFPVIFWVFVVMSFQDRIGSRRKAYKNTVDSADNRRRREDEAIQIGKRDKDEQVARRRRLVEMCADIDDDVSWTSNNITTKCMTSI